MSGPRLHGILAKDTHGSPRPETEVIPKSLTRFIVLLAASGVPGLSAPRQGPPPDLAPVTFRLQSLPNQQSNGQTVRRWLCTHKGRKKTARFRFELASRSTKKGQPFIITQAAFYRETNSDPTELLIALRKSLEAKRLPKQIKRLPKLTCDVAILGVSQSKGDEKEGGGFSSNPHGDWLVMKLFVSDGNGEFFFNLNPKSGIGEFSIKDSEYGDIVLRDLAKVL